MTPLSATAGSRDHADDDDRDRQKQAEKAHHRPITMASVYCLGIIGTFTGLGMLVSVIFGAPEIGRRVLTVR